MQEDLSRIAVNVMTEINRNPQVADSQAVEQGSAASPKIGHSEVLELCICGE